MKRAVATIVDPPTTPSTRRTVGIIGLGAMGGPIAASLLRAGHDVMGYDIKETWSQGFESSGGRAASSVAEVVKAASVMLISLPSAASLRQVVDEILASDAGTAGGLIVVEMSTLDLASKIEARDRLAASGIVTLDCPLSGTAVQALKGDLVVYASGDREACTACESIFSAFARSVHYLGEFGTGTKTKLVANLLVAVHIVAAAEALALARKAGLVAETTLRAIVDGAGNSRMLEVRGPMMIERSFETPSMRIGLFRKDLELIREFADALECPIPILAAAAQSYAAALAAGRADEDTSAVYAIAEEMAGLVEGGQP